MGAKAPPCPAIMPAPGQYRCYTFSSKAGAYCNRSSKAILNRLEFKLDMTGTDLINFNSFALHWGETCQDDVIEGATSVVSAPGGIPPVMFGLGAMVFRRQAGLAALS